MPTINTFPLILTGVFLNAAAQLLLKEGMTRIGYFSFSWENTLPIVSQILLSPFILLGLSAYAFSVVVWLLVLSRIDVSIAYPMLSLGYVVVAIASYYLFQESLSSTRILGMLVIVGGVYLLYRN